MCDPVLYKNPIIEWCLKTLTHKVGIGTQTDICFVSLLSEVDDHNSSSSQALKNQSGLFQFSLQQEVKNDTYLLYKIILCIDLNHFITSIFDVFVGNGFIYWCKAF